MLVFILFVYDIYFSLTLLNHFALRVSPTFLLFITEIEQ